MANDTGRHGPVRPRSANDRGTTARDIHLAPRPAPGGGLTRIPPWTRGGGGLIALLLLVAVLPSPAPASAPAAVVRDTRPKSEPFTFVVLSDTHLLRRDGRAVSLYPATERIVERIVRAERPAFVVHCGDLLSLNRRDDEATARAQMALVRDGLLAPLDHAGIPLLPTPGNHDVIAAGRAVYDETFARRTPPVPLLFGSLERDYAFAYGGALFISLDGSGVALRTASRERLETLLAGRAGRDRPVFLMVHIGAVPRRRHPKARLAGLEPEALAARGVTHILSGHQHELSIEEVGGLTHIIAGSAGETKPYPYLVVTVADGRATVEAREGR